MKKEYAFEALLLLFFLAMLLFFITQLAHGQALPDAPSHVMDKKFLAVTAANLGATVADVETTRTFLRSGACVESNSFFGPHPSTGKMYGVELGLFGAETVLSYELKKHVHSRWVWMLPGLGSATAHSYSAIHNRECL